MILAKRVYRDFPISINYKNTMDDLAQLDMVYFDVILGMDWIIAFDGLKDFRTQVVKFQMPNETIFEWSNS